MRSIILDLLLEKKRVKTRALYHIGPRPASPKPKSMGQHRYTTPEWERSWLEKPVKAGVFMTPNPLSIAQHHGIYGNVYAYEVPEWVIKKAGGINRYDWGSEILIPEDLWNQAATQIKLIGKKMSKKKLIQKVQRHWEGPKPGRLGWYDSMFSEDDKLSRKQDRIRSGLRATKHLDDAISMMTRQEREEALAAFEDVPEHQQSWDGQGRSADDTIVATLKRRLQENRALLETMRAWRIRHDT